MQEIYDLLKSAEMRVIASPIYYHGLSGQIKCVIDRFHSSDTGFIEEVSQKIHIGRQDKENLKNAIQAGCIYNFNVATWIKLIKILTKIRINE